MRDWNRILVDNLIDLDDSEARELISANQQLRGKLLVARATLIKAKKAIGCPIAHPLAQELFTEIHETLEKTG